MKPASDGMSPLGSNHVPAISRRRLLQSTAAAIGAVAAAGGPVAAADQPPEPPRRGRIRQSICQWCFREHWDLEQMCQVAKSLGCRSIELVDPKQWDVLKRHGLVCAIAGSHGFQKGPNDPRNWDFCRQRLTDAIDACAAAGFPSVITFTGMKVERISPEQAADNCVAFFKEIVPLAEKNKVTLCLEMLNTRDDSHPMKGHPGYQGDHTDYCVDIIHRVGSPRLKLLFDVYHVQIMDGDCIRRIRQLKDLIGHVHTAGNPGRGELDQTQEINYPPIMRALLEIGYQGYVGQEFIPTRDPLQGLKQAVAVCDV